MFILLSDETAFSPQCETTSPQKPVNSVGGSLLEFYRAQTAAERFAEALAESLG